MSARVIVTGSKKGGSGKTLFTQHLAGLAVLSGYKTCVIDLCQSRNLSKGLNSIAFPEYEFYKRENRMQEEEFLASWSQEYINAEDMLLNQNLDKPVLTFPLNIPRIDFPGRPEEPDIHVIVGSAQTDYVGSSYGDPDHVIDLFRASIYDLVERHQFDYIFIDIGPNGSPSFHAALYSATDLAIVARCVPDNEGNVSEFYDNIQEILAYREQEGTPAAYHGLIITDLDMGVSNKTSPAIALKYRDEYEEVFERSVVRRNALMACYKKEYVWCVNGSSAYKARQDLIGIWNELDQRVRSIDLSIPLPNSVGSMEEDDLTYKYNDESPRRQVAPPSVVSHDKQTG